MKKIGVAIIGTGYWGVNYVRMFGELPQSRVAVVCDRSQERLDEIGRRFPGIELTTDVRDALSREGVDAAVICTPATTHFEIAARCLEVGKHLLIEKPITTVAAEGEVLLAMAQKRELTLMVGHTFIHNAAVRKLKAYIEGGEVGRPYYLYSRRTNMGPIRRDVNALWDLAPHDISIFNHLLGSVPQWASAVGARVLNNSREDVGFISLGYPGGVIGHIHVSWADPNKVRELVVVGSDRRLVFDDLNALERVRVFEKGVRSMPPEASSYGEHQIQMRDGDIISPRIEASEPLKNQCGHFLECVSQGMRPITGGREGIDVVRVMHAIDLSLERNGAPVVVEQSADVAASSLDRQISPEVLRVMWEAVGHSVDGRHEPSNGVKENQ